MKLNEILGVQKPKLNKLLGVKTALEDLLGVGAGIGAVALSEMSQTQSLKGSLMPIATGKGFGTPATSMQGVKTIGSRLLAPIALGAMSVKSGFNINKARKNFNKDFEAEVESQSRLRDLQKQATLKKIDIRKIL